MANLWVNGIVASRDKQPYVQLSNDDGIVAQLTMAQARMVAIDILQMSARTEADALLLKFATAMDYPEMTGAALMTDFRDFRAALDAEVVGHGSDEPPHAPPRDWFGDKHPGQGPSGLEGL